MAHYRDRLLIDGTDRAAWLEKREGRCGGSDAAKYAKVESAHLYIRDKLHNSFGGNAYTRHGQDDEARILAAFGVQQNTGLYHAEGNERHVATPDGIVENPVTGEIVLVQCKTYSKPFTRLSPAYQRQMWWEQYVLGAERTLFVWDEHDQFERLHMEPQSLIFERDDQQIEKLITIADLVLAGMDAAEAFRRELQL